MTLSPVLDRLAKMPDVVADAARGAAPADLSRRPHDCDWSLVEQACHLRDLEVEGYAVRIGRLLAEENPQLADFDGGRVAIERDYRAQDFHAALAAFRDARLANVRAVERLGDEELARSGVFDGSRAVTLRDLLEMMAEHDAEHVRQLAALREALLL
jgi:DinB family protein